MKIAVTGASGFLGRYIVSEMLARGHQVQAWFRGDHAPEFHDPRGDSDPVMKLRWVPGQLGDPESTDRLISGADAVIHSALFHEGPNFMDDPSEPIGYFETNVIGSLRLLQSAVASGAGRFVYVSSGTVHQRVLSDRPLDETHPLLPESLYGASKASIETLIHAYGFSGKLDCCTVRPTAIYGAADPITRSKWYDLITDIAAGKNVEATGGSKEVHAADVATAIRFVLETEEPIAGETFNCSDRMISRYEVAEIAKQLSASASVVTGEPKYAKNKIVTSKIERLGMQFGGTESLKRTITQILNG